MLFERIVRSTRRLVLPGTRILADATAPNLECARCPEMLWLSVLFRQNFRHSTQLNGSTHILLNKQKSGTRILKKVHITVFNPVDKSEIILI